MTFTELRVGLACFLILCACSARDERTNRPRHRGAPEVHRSIQGGAGSAQGEGADPIP